MKKNGNECEWISGQSHALWRRTVHDLTPWNERFSQGPRLLDHVATCARTVCMTIIGFLGLWRGTACFDRTCGSDGRGDGNARQEASRRANKAVDAIGANLVGQLSSIVHCRAHRVARGLALGHFLLCVLAPHGQILQKFWNDTLADLRKAVRAKPSLDLVDFVGRRFRAPGQDESRVAHIVRSENARVHCKEWG